MAPPPPPPTELQQKNNSGARKLFVLPLKKGTRVSATLLILLCVITSAWIFSSLKSSDVTSRVQNLSVNVQNDAIIEISGIQQSFVKVQNDVTTENSGIQQSSVKVQNDATIENPGIHQSSVNVQNDTTIENPGIHQSSVNVQNDITIENPGIQQSSVSIQDDATTVNPGIQQSSVNVKNEATSENPGIQQSSVNLQNDATTENPGIQKSSVNVQNDATIENPGIRQSSVSVQNDATTENPGIQQSSVNVKNEATSENPGQQQRLIEKPAVMEINEIKKQIKTSKEKIKAPKKLENSLICSAGNETQTCSSTPASGNFTPSNVTCPEYFRWIHEDLKPFVSTGISRDMVERAKTTANFRLVILKGKVYIEKYKKSIQTRDLFTIWGIVQLLRMYPGKLPDLEMMFDCNDRPVIHKKLFRGANATTPPPLFRYCGDPWSLDIVFPDWSFWGWAEINIRPWKKIVKEMKKGNKKIKWMDREPYAYWKGNPFVAETRQDLLKCNVSDKYDWNARLFVQDWIQEGEQGFKQSNLADQCTHRYKIYIEGFAWSVSEKYILACDSPTLLVNTKYYDFFLRHLQPTQHYWPIRDDEKCKSIQFAVNWGNNHKQKAQEIGKAASSFMLEDLKMKFVYDYMFHLLNEYAKLLRFEVIIPAGAPEMCSETMACHADGREKKFMIESMVKIPSSTTPCSLPPPYDLKDLARIFRRRDNSMNEVRKWETNFWEITNKNAKV